MADCSRRKLKTEGIDSWYFPLFFERKIQNLHCFLKEKSKFEVALELFYKCCLCNCWKEKMAADSCGTAAAEERARAQVRQLGQRRQRAVHALLRERAQGQGRRRQDDQPQRPRREPGGLLHGRAVAEPLRGAGADASAARAPAQRRAAGAGAGVAQPLRRVAVPPPPRRKRRRAGRRWRRRVQRRTVPRAPVQLRECRVRPRGQLRRPVPRQGRLARQRDADEGLGGAQVRRLGLQPGVGGRLHAHLQQGEGGEADPGGEAGGVRQGRRAWQRRQAAPRRRLRLIEILVLWMVQVEIECLMNGDDDGYIQMLVPLGCKSGQGGGCDSAWTETISMIFFLVVAFTSIFEVRHRFGVMVE